MKNLEEKSREVKKTLKYLGDYKRTIELIEKFPIKNPIIIFYESPKPYKLTAQHYP
jgi:hypothetical protein